MKDRDLPSVRSIRAVITTSELLSPAARRLISGSFKAHVFNEYGCGEVGSIAHECEHGTLHTMADNLIVEVDSGTSNGSIGELIVTDLFNFSTPLIRYRLGDFSSANFIQCQCGRTLPAIGEIRGRAYDLIHLRSGRVLHPEALMYILESIQQRTSAFRQFQIVQESLDRFTVRLVPNGVLSADTANAVIAEFHQHVSATAFIDVVRVTDLPREPSGKMRVVKSQVSRVS
jgi:phenylacetate-CoA ligase